MGDADPVDHEERLLSWLLWASVSLVLAGMIYGYFAVPSEPVVIAGFELPAPFALGGLLFTGLLTLAVFAGAFRLKERRTSRTSAYLLVGGWIFLVLGIEAFLAETGGGFPTLGYLVVPIMLSASLLSVWGTLAVSGFAILQAITQPVLFPAERGTVGGLVSLFGIVAVLGVVFARFRREEMATMEAQQEDLGYIQDGVQDLDVLMQGLRSYAEVLMSDHAVEMVDIADVIERVRDELAGLIESRDATITVDESAEVTGNREQLEALFRELLENALVHTQDGVRIHIGTTPDSETQVRFTVQDDGPGIPSEYHERAFNLFETLDAKIERSAGLGLALAEEVVHRHGGSSLSANPPAGDRV